MGKIDRVRTYRAVVPFPRILWAEAGEASWLCAFSSVPPEAFRVDLVATVWDVRDVEIVICWKEAVAVCAPWCIFRVLCLFKKGSRLIWRLVVYDYCAA